MILVMIDKTRIVITGHARSQAACAAVSTVSQLLRHRATCWYSGKRASGIPSGAVLRRQGDELDRRAVSILATIAKEYPRDVTFVQETP